MLEIVSKSKLRVKPLTIEEQQWVRQLATCLENSPGRLEFLTAGDQLKIVDKIGAKNSDLCDGAAERDGIVLARLPGPICHGVS
jgi:hypothetical protein